MKTHFKNSIDTFSFIHCSLFTFKFTGIAHEFIDPDNYDIFIFFVCVCVCVYV